MPNSRKTEFCVTFLIDELAVLRMESQGWWSANPCFSLPVWFQSERSAMFRRPRLAALLVFLVLPQVSPADELIATWTNGGGTGQWNLPTNWSPGVVPTNSNPDNIFFSVRILNGDTVQTLGFDPHVDGLMLSPTSTLALTNGTVLSVHRNPARPLSGLIENAGLITLNSTGMVTQLELADGDVTLTGSGTIRLGNHVLNRISGLGAGRLINEDNTIAGSGQLGLNSLGIVNRGLILADQPVALVVDPNTLGLVNEGVMRAENGATLSIIGGNFNNTGGLVHAADGSLVTLGSVLALSGGELRSTGTGVIRATGLTTLDGTAEAVIVNADFQVANSVLVDLAGTIQNTGTGMTLGSTGSVTQFEINGEVTLSGGGNLLMGNHLLNRIAGVDPLARLVNENNLVSGSGSLGLNSLELVNRATIRANQSVALTIDPNSAGVTNEGLLLATNGATLALDSGIYVNTTGTIRAEDLSLVTLSGAEIRGGLLETDGSGLIRVTTATTLNGATSAVTLDGRLAINNAQTLTVLGTLHDLANTIEINSAGSVTQFQASGAVVLDGGGTLALSNHVLNRVVGTGSSPTLVNHNLIRGSGSLGLNSLAIDNRGTILGDSSAGLTIDPNTDGFINGGVIRAEGGVVTLSSGQFENAAGQLQVAAGNEFRFTGATIGGGLLSGEGTGFFNALTGTVLDGTASPVALQGELRVANAITLDVRGTLEQDGVVRLLPAGSVTQLRFTDTVTLGGNGTVDLGNHTLTRVIGAGATPTLINQGNLIHGGGSLGFNSLAIRNHGTILADESVALTVDPSATGFVNESAGTVRVAGGSSLILTGGTFDNHGLIDLMPGSSASVTTGGNLANLSGTVAIAAGAQLAVTGSFNQAGGQVELAGGTLDSTVGNFFQGGALTGNGTVGGATSFSAGSLLAAGASAGVLVFEESVGISGLVEVELGGLLVNGALPSLSIVNTGLDPLLADFDQVHVWDALTLGAGSEVSVLLIGGFMPADGDFFDILTADSLTLDGLAVFSWPGVPGLEFTPEVLDLFDPVRGQQRDVLRITASVSAIPEPGGMLAVLMVTTGLLTSRRRMVPARA